MLDTMTHSAADSRAFLRDLCADWARRIATRREAGDDQIAIEALLGAWKDFGDAEISDEPWTITIRALAALARIVADYDDVESPSPLAMKHAARGLLTEYKAEDAIAFDRAGGDELLAAFAD